MKISKIAAVSVLALGLGVWNPMTNTAMASTAAPTTVSGTFDINFTITVKSAVTSQILCDATVEVDDDMAGSYTEEAEGEAVRSVSTPSTATCKLTIPYSWALETPTTDRYFFQYTVTNSTFTTLGVSPTLPIRISKPFPASILGIPKNGATTTENVSVTY